MAFSCKTYAMSSLKEVSSLLAMSNLLTEILPDDGVHSLSSNERTVLLPAPEDPTSAQDWPGSMEREREESIETLG